MTDKPPPEEIVLYAKDPATKIATITLNRPGYLRLEGMLPLVKDKGGIAVDSETFEKGLAAAVKDNDARFPPRMAAELSGPRGKGVTQHASQTKLLRHTERLPRPGIGS